MYIPMKSEKYNRVDEYLNKGTYLPNFTYVKFIKVVNQNTLKTFHFPEFHQYIMLESPGVSNIDVKKVENHKAKCISMFIQIFVCIYINMNTLSTSSIINIGKTTF